ncbi:MAG: osmoprotectant transport system substrate-binding protein [Chloroflexota bacterium]|jgi:osmoprotectant transport system substrate-binding protein|nr:osmoprotectant transport system substrate-binding protein [Chloroflexota bacterium]
MKRRKMLALAMMGSAILAGCGSSSSSGTGDNSSATCPTGGSASSTGTGTFKIGMKGFAEEQLLASMTKQLLEKRGYTVDATFTAKDPALGQALESGQIDMYWQYTGTEFIGPLSSVVDKPPTDLDQAFDLAKQKDEARGICWNAKANFNDTNGLGIKASDKSKYGSTLTEFAAYLKNNPNTVVCIQSEFRTRADGVPGLNATYGIDANLPGFKDIGGNTAEKQIASGECAAGEVFTTDSGIEANNVYVLTDDKKLFPPDNVGLLIKSSVQKAHPELGAIVAPLAQKLTTEKMIGLNKQVEIDSKKVEDVAKAFLTDNGFL